MKRMIWLFTGVLMLLAACSGLVVHQTSTQPPVKTANPLIVVTDALGREVTLQAPPQRIVITGKALIMIADAIYTFPEAPARIVALGKASQGTGNFIALIDPAYADKAIIKQDASAEQIAALQPDLVILKSSLAETTGKPIEALGIPVVYVDFETPEQYTRDLAILGKVLQNESRAQEVAAYYQSRVDRIQAAIEGVEGKPRVLMLYYSDLNGSVAFNVPPLSWMQTRLVEMAGGAPVWADANPGKGWTQVSLEQVAAWDADQIFIISYNKNSSDVVAGLKTDPNWQALRSVQEGHLYAFPGDLFSWDQPDTRWVLGLTWLAGRLHPERFPNLDIVGEAQQYYQALYGLDQAFFDQQIRPTFKGDLP
jgi:iron complex transport system substrate-binding protein